MFPYTTWKSTHKNDSFEVTTPNVSEINIKKLNYIFDI
jgi:hypothetical protein